MFNTERISSISSIKNSSRASSSATFFEHIPSRAKTERNFFRAFRARALFERANFRASRADFRASGARTQHYFEVTFVTCQVGWVVRALDCHARDPWFKSHWQQAFLLRKGFQKFFKKWLSPMWKWWDISSSSIMAISSLHKCTKVSKYLFISIFSHHNVPDTM